MDPANYPSSDEAVIRAIESILGPQMRLLMPQAPARQEHWPIGLFDMMRLYITYEEISGKPATEEDLIPLLKSVDRTRSLAILSAVSLLVDAKSNDTAISQDRLAQTLLPPEFLSRVREISTHDADSPGKVLFFEQQIQTAAKYFLMYGVDSDIAIDPTVIGHILLIAGELVDKAYTDLHRALDTEPMQDEALVSKLIQALLFQNRESIRNLFPRYFRLLVELPKDHSIQESPNYMDIAGVFRRSAGISPEEFLGLGFLSLLNAMIAASKRNALIGPPDVAIDQDSLQRNLSLDPSVLNDFLNSLSADASTFENALLADATDPDKLYYDFRCMQAVPLFRPPIGPLTPLTHRLYKERLTSGLYWILHRHLRESDGALFKKFTRFFGELFELHVVEIFSRMFSRNWGRLYLERETTPHGSDLMIPYGKDIILFEVSSSRFISETRIYGMGGSFARDLEKLVRDNAKQLNRVANALSRGELRITGFDDTNGVIWPLVVMIEPWPEFPLIRNRTEELLRQYQYLQSPNIRPLLFLSAEEVELLEPLVRSGRSLREILEAKLRDVDYKHVSMKNYLYARVTGAGELSAEMLDLFERALNPAKSYLKLGEEFTE